MQALILTLRLSVWAPASRSKYGASKTSMSTKIKLMRNPHTQAYTPMTNDSSPHTPVLSEPILETLQKFQCHQILDATFGAGSLTTHILSNIKNAVVSASDRDPSAIKIAEHLSQKFPNRLIPKEARFANLDTTFFNSSFDAVIFDCGVSSPQIDQSNRGFSFQKNGPLDMRMSQNGITAAHIVNSYSNTQLASIFKTFGEERFANKIANSIVKRRETKLFTETLDLAEHIKAITPYQKIHPATRVFQALRIAVNEELTEITIGLKHAISLLKNEGILLVITFHSLEHKTVKNTLSSYIYSPPKTSRYQPEQKYIHEHPFALKYIERCLKPSDQEIHFNERSRSAQMRICQKINLETSS